MTNYTKQDYERDLKIVADAPSVDGFEHDAFLYCEGIPNGYVIINDSTLYTYQCDRWCKDRKWSYPSLQDCWDIHSLQDIRDKIALYEANQKLIAAINESIKDRYEQYDHAHHVYCNFCDGNLTKSKGVHDDDCILKELTND